MTDLQTKNVILAETHLDLPFVVNEFKRVRIPPKKHTEEKDFRHLGSNQQHRMMKRLIDKVKDL